MTTLELDVRARVADARVLDRHACTALLVSDPLELRRAATLFERSERPKEHTDRVAPADGILGAREVNDGTWRGVNLPQYENLGPTRGEVLDTV